MYLFRFLFTGGGARHGAREAKAEATGVRMRRPGWELGGTQRPRAPSLKPWPLPCDLALTLAHEMERHLPEDVHPRPDALG